MASDIVNHCNFPVNLLRSEIELQSLVRQSHPPSLGIGTFVE